MSDMKRRLYQTGAAAGSIVAIILLTLMVLFFAGFSGWMYMQYTDAKTDVDGQIEAALAEGLRKQSEADEKKFLEREKQPFRQFVGPDDYGRVTFDYPKTWSAFQATDLRAGGGVTYYAYLNPNSVPPVEPKDARVAIRIIIEQKVYDQVLASYDKLVKAGDLKVSAWNDNNNGLSGTKLEGSFTKDIRGTAVLIKMRDRTLTVRTDSDVFPEDYVRALKTLNFNQ